MSMTDVTLPNKLIEKRDEVFLYEFSGVGYLIQGIIEPTKKVFSSHVRRNRKIIILQFCRTIESFLQSVL